MRYELEKYFSNPCESSGLLIAEAPTGYGKTYETIQAIYQYIEKGGSSQVLFITTLLKNLPVDELRNLYEKNGRGVLFEKEVLVLPSAESSVEKAILTEKIPLEFQTDAYQELLSACRKKKQYQEQFGEAGKEITKHLGNQIREKLEPQFRHELEDRLRKDFPEGSGPRLEAIRNKEKYKWMAKFAFDFEAIARDFSIFEARRDQGNYWKSRVPDVALQECRALAVVYEWGTSCYILYHRASAEQYSLKQALECCEDNVRVQEISVQELAKTKKHLLVQLLCNALPSIQTNGELYHNVTGKLYYMNPGWFYYRKEVLASFWTLQISFTKDGCVKLDVKTFSNTRIKQDCKNKPQYLFDPECYILRRALRDDPGKSTDHFVIGALNQRRKNTVSFLEFGSLPDYQNCKVGILNQFLRDVQTSLSPYLSLKMVSLDESTHLGVCGSVDSMTGIRNRLRETPLYLEDTVQNEQSRTLISMLRYELAQYSGVTFMEGTPGKDDALLRIIHYPLFYEDHPEDDCGIFSI